MTTDNEQSHESLRYKMAHGVAWMIGMRWAIRAIGLVNTIILARLLTPQDFGIVAMATVVIGFLDSLTDFRVDVAILREETAGQSRYDSAWTLQVLSGFLKAGILIGIAPLLASYYGDSRVELVVFIISAGAAISGFENIGQVEFRRQLTFEKEFRYQIYRRLITFVATLVIVLWLRSYLALALAQPVTAIVTVVLSYVMASYRPRLSLRYTGQLWAVSRWLTLLGVMRYFGRRGEAFVLGGLTTPRVIGEYEVSASLSSILTEEFGAAAGRVFLPSYAKLSQDPYELRRVFVLSLSFLAAISLAIGAGASLLADKIILVLLGSQWINAVPLFQWLALHGAFMSIVDSMQPYFFVVKQEKMISLCYTGYVAILVPAIVASALISDVETVALTRTVITFLFLSAMILILVKKKGFTVGSVLNMIWRPVLATILMVLAILSISTPGGPIISLVLDLMVGGLAYLVALLVIWFFAGRPYGLESVAIAMASNWIYAKKKSSRRL